MKINFRKNTSRYISSKYNGVASIYLATTSKQKFTFFYLARLAILPTMVTNYFLIHTARKSLFNSLISLYALTTVAHLS